MQKILIDCRSLEDARILKSYIEREMPYEPILSFDAGETDQMLNNRSVHLLVIQTGILRETEMERIRMVRSNGYVYPILTITDRIGDLAITVWRRSTRLTFWRNPSN